MAVIKIACPRCGQKVSGDESFFGTSVECPVCTSQIEFPQNPNAPASSPPNDPPLPQVPYDEADRPPARDRSPHDSSPPEYVEPQLPSAGDDFDDVPRRVTSSVDTAPPQSSEEIHDLPKADPLSDGTKIEPEGSANASPPLMDDSADYHNPREIEADEDELDEVPSPALAATSLVLGILSIITCLFTAILTAPGAVICGHLALARAKHSPVKPAPGKTLALIGTILGYLSLILLLIALALLPVIKAFFERSAEGV